GAAVDRRAATGRAPGGAVPARGGRERGGMPAPDRALARRGQRRGRGLGPGPVGSPARRGAGQDPRFLPGPAAQPLAPVPGALLPPLVPLRVLPGGGGVRLPRSDPGRSLPGGDPARAGPRAPAAFRRPAIRGSRRAALVASADRPRREDPHLRRPSLAPLRG